MSDLSYTLKKPIVLRTQAHDGTVTTEVLRAAGSVVALREAEADDLLILDKHSDNLVAATKAMITALSDLDPTEAGKLKAVDFAGLGELLAEFMEAGQMTGATS